MFFKKKDKVKKELYNVQLEKNDIPAMIIAGFLMFLPILIIIIAIFFFFIWFIFLR